MIFNSLAWDTRALGRKDLGPELPGGFFVVDPEDGSADHLQPDRDLKYLVPASDGRALYGIEMGAASSEAPRLFAFDGANGSVRVVRELERTSWHLAIARIPAPLIPLERVEATTSEPAAWSAPRPDVRPGALLLDYGRRDGWDSGRAGAARGALVPLHPETAEELAGYRPANAPRPATVRASPSGRLLALLKHQTQRSDARLVVVDRATWTEIEAFEAAPSRLHALAWSRESTLLFGLQPPGSYPPRGTEIWSFDVRSGVAQMIVEADLAAWDPPIPDPDEATIYLFAWRAVDCCAIEVRVQGDPFIAAVDIESGAIDEIPLPGVFTAATAITPDGARLFVAHADEDRVTVVDLERRVVERTFRPERPRSALSRFGTWLLGLSTGRAEAKGGPSFHKQALVSADGRWLYITGTRDEVCQGSHGFPCVERVPIGLQVIDTETLDLVEEFDGVGEIAVTPDGRWIVGIGTAFDYGDEGAERATVVGFGLLTVIDTQTLKVRGRIDGGPSLHWRSALTPGSRTCSRQARVGARRCATTAGARRRAMSSRWWSCPEHGCWPRGASSVGSS